VWSTASNAERSTDLHGPQNTLLLLGLLALARPDRIGIQRAALAGVALGLATSVELWQAISATVVLWWVAVRARGDGLDRLRTVLAYLASVGIAFGLVCVPFLAVAPEAMIGQVLLDQIGRPNMGIDTIDRLRVLEGFPQLAQLPPMLRRLVPDVAVVVAAAAGLVLVIATAWRCPWTRLWAALAIVQSAVVLVTPSFFNDYPSLAAPAATLVLGTGIAVAIGGLTRRGLRPAPGRAAIVVVLAVLSVGSLARVEGRALPLADLARDLSSARCVAADSPTLLLVTGVLQGNLDAACPLVLDPSGMSYHTERGRLIPGPAAAARRNAPGYQQAMVDWYTSGDAALFVRLASDGLTAATESAIEQRLPVERHRGIVTVRLER
jgi:hypothetical protein